MFELFHYLHVSAGIFIGGSEILISYVVLPAMLKLGPQPRKDYILAINKYAGPLMVTALLALLIGAFGQVWTSGVISGFGDLFQGYGLMVTLALVVLIAWQGFDGPNRSKMTKAAEALDTEQFKTTYKRGRIATTLALTLLIALMGAMRLGLY